MAVILDGKKTSAEIREELRREVEGMPLRPGLAVIMAGDNPASAIYVRNKIKACEEVGIQSFAYNFRSDVTFETVRQCILDLNADDRVHGILVQLPLPEHLDSQKLLELIDVNKDVDGFSATSVGNLMLGRDGFRSCTPYGVIKLLERYGVEISGKSAVVIGRSNIVGKPMAVMLLEHNATVTICHSRTAELERYTRQADIVVSATGNPMSVTASMIKPGAVVIDVGISKVMGKTVGDVCFEQVEPIASYITPVPGGVGPMTITMLMYNTVKAAKRTYERN